LSGNIRIGTSGWHYKHWRGPFYPGDLPAAEMLSFYARHFDTVEINNSFYRLPAVATFESWRDSAPARFSFAVKASRYITHMKKLKDPEASLEKLLSRAEALKRKLGPILFQLPPNWRCDAVRLTEFLERLPRKRQYSFELRDPSWHTPEVYKLLSRHNAAFCIYELAGFQSPLEVTADFVYVRLHGPKKEAYQGNYHTAALQTWAHRIREWQRDLKVIYVYFDNDQEGFAAKNALALKRLVGNRDGSEV
jgi:uncharacterized protein YecE (DUF72 family)